MIQAIKAKLAESAKAIAAVGAPIAIHFVNEVTVEASKQATGLLAVLAAALAVYFTPNAKKA